MEEQKVAKRINAHNRWHPFERIWVLNSPQRLSRKWLGKKNKKQPISQKYDKDCPFCPGNKRADGVMNPIKKSDYPFAFDNDFPAILSFEGNNLPIHSYARGDNLYLEQSIYGKSRIVNFHYQHNLTFALMSNAECGRVVKLWQKEYEELGQISYIKTVNIFENNGFGSSLPHPHNQIICSSDIPSYLKQILTSLKQYQEKHHQCLLCQTQREELGLNERVIYQNKDFVAFVPFWAIWPFEVWVVSKKHKKSLLEFDNDELSNLANAYKMVVIKLDNLFKAPCPYSSSVYQAPVGNCEHPEMHFHIVFRPPVLRDTKVWKWMVGYEFMAQPQRDITPEEAASLLKATSNIHFSKKNKRT